VTPGGPPHYVRICEGLPFADVSGWAPFLAIVVLDASYSPDWQNVASEWLVDSGCLYMMAWGPNCSSWDDSVDWVNIERFEGRDIPDASFVMTTWHDREPIEEVFWFAGHAANHWEVELRNTLIVDVSESDRATEMIARFNAAKAEDQASE
jgi:hypothetical protein